MAPKLFLSYVFIFFSTQFFFGQHIKIDKKELSILASLQKVNVIFTYEKVLFNADNFNETDFLSYIKEKIENKLNFEEALEWETRHLLAKDSIYPKIFVAALNNRIKDYDDPLEFVLNDTSLRYTMKVQTSWMYFGYDAGIVKQPAKANLNISFFETSEPANIISEVEVNRAEGLNVIGNLSFISNDTHGLSGISSIDWLDEFLNANEDYPRPSLVRMGNMYDKAAVRFGMTLKRVLD